MKESAAVIRKVRLRSEKIVNAALELFCEKGIEDTSIDDVAADAGVGSATIYRYFETKAELAVRTGVACWKKIENTVPESPVRKEIRGDDRAGTDRMYHGCSGEDF